MNNVLNLTCIALFAIGIGVVVLPVWLAARAKPIGNQPDCWGTWVGLVSVGYAVGAPWLLSAAHRKASTWLA